MNQRDSIIITYSVEYEAGPLSLNFIVAKAIRGVPRYLPT